MTTPMQKADQRPISFVLHNMAFGEPPVEVKLVIRPEDLTRTDTSRLNTVQTIGGAWADNFGPGIPVVQIAGTTGWGSAGRQDGLEAFQNLHQTIFVDWHKKRAEVLKAGLDPDLVKLIFLDKLDQFEWVVAPQNFVLKRNKQRPLLSQYQISLTWLSYDVAESLDALDSLFSADSLSDLELDGLDSMMHAVEKIEQFASDLSSKIGGYLKQVQGVFNRIVTLTAKVLRAVNRIIAAGMGVVSTITNGLLGLATSLTRAAANITGIVQGIISVPMRIKAQFQRAFLAFENAFCVLRNIFRRRQFLPNYDSLYGASLCSSTAGGRPISRYDTENPWPVLYPVKTSAISVSGSASSALSRLATADPVLARPTMAMLGADMQSVNNGVTVTA